MNKKDHVIAIHQPNFFPWLGFFDKIARADVMVLLDNVQYPNTNFVSRVKLLVSGEAKWVTAFVNGHIAQEIREIQFVERPDWRKKLIGSLQMNYARAPFYKENFEWIVDLIRFETKYLFEFNLNSIKFIKNQLKLDKCKIIIGSDLHVTQTSTAMLIEMIKQLGGTRYLSGNFAKDAYMEEALFSATHIKLEYQNFIHPIYAQTGAKIFVPGLSIIDVLMNIGLEATKRLLERRSLNEQN
jgi:hypothetical protein